MYKTKTQLKQDILGAFDNDPEITDDLLFNGNRFLENGVWLLHEVSDWNKNFKIMSINYTSLQSILPNIPKVDYGGMKYDEIDHEYKHEVCDNGVKLLLSSNDFHKLQSKITNQTLEVLNQKLQSMISGDDFYFLNYDSSGDFHIAVGGTYPTTFQLLEMSSDKEKITFLLQENQAEPKEI